MRQPQTWAYRLARPQQSPPTKPNRDLQPVSQGDVANPSNVAKTPWLAMPWSTKSCVKATCPSMIEPRTLPSIPQQRKAKKKTPTKPPPRPSKPNSWQTWRRERDANLPPRQRTPLSREHSKRRLRDPSWVEVGRRGRG